MVYFSSVENQRKLERFSIHGSSTTLSMFNLIGVGRNSKIFHTEDLAALLKFDDLDSFLMNL